MIRIFISLGLLIPIALSSQTIFNFTRQGQIDSFNINNPNVKNVTKLNLNGKDIFNLDSLYSITNIKSVSIIGTGINNLKGLNNVYQTPTTTGQASKLVLENNEQLESLEGIENFDFWFIVIINNPKLEFCNLQSICNFFKKNYYYYMRGNGSGCKNIYNQCYLECDLDFHNLIIHQGFEKIDELHTNHDDLGFDGKEILEINKSIGSGQYSLKIRNNVPGGGGEGPGEAGITIELDQQYKKIDLEFTYQCLGHGFCNISYYRDFPFFNAEAGDSTTYTICLEDIVLQGDNLQYDKLYFLASPVFTPTGSFGQCEFIIDDINIYVEQEQLDVSHKSQLNIFPNPTHNWINIESDSPEGNLFIFDPYGKLVYFDKYSHAIDVSGLKNGLYILTHEMAESICTYKFVKL